MNRIDKGGDMRYISVILFVMSILGCDQDSSIEQKSRIKMKLAAETSLLPATVWVAEDLGYFEEEKIDLTIQDFDSGRNALETMLKDETIDMATVAQTPVVFNSFNNEDYVIIATMAYSVDDVKVLARKDFGIIKPADLVGKKIGVTLRTTGHYFLEGYLAHYGKSLSDVDIYDVNAATLKEKLISGELDAITTWEPHIYNTKKILNENQLTLLISPTPFRKDFYFTVSRSYAVEHKERVKRFLSAVIRAENYIKQHPEKSKEIVSRRLNVDPKIVSSIWSSFMFNITLEQSILVGLENEAQWAIDTNLKKGELPNYLNFISIKALKEVKPEAVNIIH